jgi:hypothetical protein
MVDLLTKKQIGDIDKNIRDIMLNLKFKNKPIKLNGSSSLKSTRYFADYDFSTIIGKLNINDYEEFNRILEYIKSNNFIYFIELKIQLLNGDKIRCYTIEEFTFDLYKKHFYDVNFIKIDIISYIDYKFIEMSVIYDCGNKTINLIDSIKNDINELMKEGKYYKVLKRLFSLNRLLGIKGDHKLLKQLTDIFNSEYGLLYSNISNVEACKTVKDRYKDKLTKTRIKDNLRYLGVSINNIDKYLTKNNKILNNYAKSLF